MSSFNYLRAYRLSSTKFSMQADIYFDRRFNFLGELYLQLKKAEFSYKLYLTNNRSFLFAKILKGSNDAILDLLNSHSFLLSPELMEESIKLITHLSIWKEKWEDLEKKMQPDLHTEFIFQNDFTFPRDAAQKLENEYLLIRSKIA